jgi:transposase
MEVDKMSHKEAWFDDARKIPDLAMDYIRKIAVRAIKEKGYSPEDIFDIFGVSRSCIYDWLGKYKENGYQGLETQFPPGMEPKVTPEMDHWLENVVLTKTPEDFGYDQNTWDRGILATLLEKTFGLHVTEATIGNHLRQMDLTVQAPEYHFIEQDADRVDHFLKDTFPRIKRLAEKMGADIGFEDEAGVDLKGHCGRTWGRRGQTPIIRVANKRGRFNVLSIITPEGKLRFSLEEKPINGERFLEFLKQVLKLQERPLILLLDRVSFHTSKPVREFVRSHREKIRIYFLPKCSPELNPDEQVWNEVKNNRLGRQTIKTKQELKKKLSSTLHSLQKNVERIMSFFDLPSTQYARA